MSDPQKARSHPSGDCTRLVDHHVLRRPATVDRSVCFLQSRSSECHKHQCCSPLLLNTVSNTDSKKLKNSIHLKPMWIGQSSGSLSRLLAEYQGLSAISPPSETINDKARVVSTPRWYIAWHMSHCPCDLHERFTSFHYSPPERHNYPGQVLLVFSAFVQSRFPLEVATVALQGTLKWSIDLHNHQPHQDHSYTSDSSPNWSKLYKHQASAHVNPARGACGCFLSSKEYGIRG